MSWAPLDRIPPFRDLQAFEITEVFNQGKFARRVPADQFSRAQSNGLPGDLALIQVCDSAGLANQIQQFIVGTDRKHICLHRRSEEHTSELQSLAYLVCRLLLEKKKQNTRNIQKTTHLLQLVGYA